MSKIAIGAMLILITTAIHAGGMHLALRSIRPHAITKTSRFDLSLVSSVGW